MKNVYIKKLFLFCCLVSMHIPIQAEGDLFPRAEYEHYMKLIKEIDLTTHHQLQECETVLGTPCIRKATNKKVMVRQGSKETFGYPIIMMNSITKFNDTRQKKLLELYVNWYVSQKKLSPPVIPVQQQKEQIPEPLMADDEFPPEEYEHYMELIHEIDPDVYQQLHTCETVLGTPCIRKAVNEGEDEVFLGTLGYPMIMINSLQAYTKEGQKKLLEFYIDWYNKLAHPLTSEERTKILQLIYSIDPELHKAIVTIDPTGKQHIERYYNGIMAVSLSVIDGLPIINVGEKAFKNPDKYPDTILRAMLAHELGHYVSGHFFQQNEPIHENVSHKPQFIRGKRIYQLPAKKTIALADNRIKEYEADRSAILDFGINITDATKALRNKPLKDITKMTFISAHPMGVDRIDHINSLAQEVELRKARGEPLKKQFDWQKLADEYLKIAEAD